MSPRKPLLRWFGLASLVVVLDQISKHVIQQRLGYGESINVTPFFDLVLVYNPGAAFSFLSDAPGWQRDFFIAVGLIACAFITWLLFRHRDKPMFCLALALVLGGAVGNLIDRFVLTAVVDFLHFHAGRYYWPAFNLADSAITCGAGLLVWDSFFDRRRRPGHAPASGDK